MFPFMPWSGRGDATKPEERKEMLLISPEVPINNNTAHYIFQLQKAKRENGNTDNTNKRKTTITSVKSDNTRMGKKLLWRGKECLLKYSRVSHS